MDKQTLLMLSGIILVIYFVLNIIFKYLEIPFYKYGFFMYWVLAIVLLALALPQKTGDIFS